MAALKNNGVEFVRLKITDSVKEDECGSWTETTRTRSFRSNGKVLINRTFRYAVDGLRSSEETTQSWTVERRANGKPVTWNKVMEARNEEAFDIWVEECEERGETAVLTFSWGIRKQSEADKRRNRRAATRIEPGHNNATHGRTEQ